MNKNILILLPNAIDPQSGGLERVYSNLIPFLKENGCNIFALYHVRSEYDEKNDYTQVYFVDERKFLKKSKRLLFQIIETRNIDTIICAYQDFRVLQCVSKIENVKVIHHIHNVPSVYLKNKMRMLPSCLVGTFVDNILREIRFRIRLKQAMENMMRNKQRIVILSEGFRKDLQSVYAYDDKMVVAIPNPFIIDNKFVLERQKKDKVLLYVGRLSERQKRISSLLNIWRKIQNSLPDYKLEIVGDGPDKDEYERTVRDKDLRRVTFRGFQDPTFFYKNAEIECMTSNFEGFGMVLVEAMQYGCVPFVFDSFAALHDVIDNKVNGYIIPAFQEDEYAEKLVNFLKMPEKEKMVIRCNAIIKSKQFNVENIGERWLNLF